MTARTLDEPLIIVQWWRNRCGEAIRVQLATCKGRNSQAT